MVKAEKPIGAAVLGVRQEKPIALQRQGNTDPTR